MNNKHKIFVVMFVGLLGFLGFRGWVFIKTKYIPAVARVDLQNEQALLDNDTDNDGLSDTEESFHGTDFRNPDTDGDGYLDGEELASGYNPRLKAPDDVKPGRISRAAPSVNLTERLTGRLAASIQAGEAETEEDLEFVLDDISYNTSIESLATFHVIYLEEGDIFVSYKSNFRTTQEYTDKVFESLSRHILPDFIAQGDDLQTMIDNFSGEGNVFRDFSTLKLTKVRDAINELSAIKTPKEFVDAHLALINKLKDIEANYVAMQESDNDILKAVLSSQNLLTNMSEFNDSLLNFVILVQTRGLNLPDNNLLEFYILQIQ